MANSRVLTMQATPSTTSQAQVATAHEHEVRRACLSLACPFPPAGDPTPPGCTSICIAPLACVCLSAYHPLPSIPITRDCASQRTWQAKREVRGGGAAHKNVALVQCEQARHATPPQSHRAAFRASHAGACLHPAGLEAHSPWPSKYTIALALEVMPPLPSNRRTKRCSRNTINSASRSK